MLEDEANENKVVAPWVGGQWGLRPGVGFVSDIYSTCLQLRYSINHCHYKQKQSFCENVFKVSILLGSFFVIFGWPISENGLHCLLDEDHL